VLSVDNKAGTFSGKMKVELGNLEPLLPVLEEMGSENESGMTRWDFVNNFSSLWREMKISKKIEDILERHLNLLGLETQGSLVEFYDADFSNMKNAAIYLNIDFEYTPLELHSEQNHKKLSENVAQEINKILKTKS
jgi:hypothetical protein